MTSFPQIKSSGRDRLENNRHLRIKACKASRFLTQFSRSALRLCSFFIILELFAILSVKGDLHPPPPKPNWQVLRFRLVFDCLPPSYDQTCRGQSALIALGKGEGSFVKLVWFSSVKGNKFLIKPNGMEICCANNQNIDLAHSFVMLSHFSFETVYIGRDKEYCGREGNV